MAVLLLDAGRPSEALIHLSRARRLQPDRRDIQFQAIRADLAIRHFADASREAQSFLIGHAEDTGAIAQLFLAAGRSAEAATYLQPALSSSGNQQECRALLAQAWLDMQRPRDVLALLSDPATASDHYFRGQAFSDLRQLQAAIAEASRAIELEPSNPRFLLFAAKLYQHLGSREAEPLLDRAIQLAPDWFEPYYSRSVSFYFQHNYAAARNSIQKALDLNQQCAQCAFLNGVILFNQGEMTQSETALRRAIVLDPKSARFRTHLAALLMRSGRQIQARAELSRAIQLSPDYALPHYQLGKLLATTSQLGEAATELEKARQIDPHLTQAHYQLGQVYLRLGKPSLAEQVLKDFRESKAKQDESASLSNDFDSALTY